MAAVFQADQLCSGAPAEPAASKPLVSTPGEDTAQDNCFLVPLLDSSMSSLCPFFCLEVLRGKEHTGHEQI